MSQFDALKAIGGGLGVAVFFAIGLACLVGFIRYVWSDRMKGGTLARGALTIIAVSVLLLGIGVFNGVNKAVSGILFSKTPDKDQMWNGVLASAALKPGAEAHRLCQPDNKVCWNTVLYFENDVQHRVYEGIDIASNKTVERLTCDMYGFKKVCTDFDTGKSGEYNVQFDIVQKF